VDSYVQIIFYKLLTGSHSSCNTVSLKQITHINPTQHTEHLIGIFVHTDM